MALSCRYLMALFPIRKLLFLFEVQQPVFRSGRSVFNAIIHTIHTILCLSPFLSYQLHSSNPMRENTIKCFYVRENLFEENTVLSFTCHPSTTWNNIAKGIRNCLLLTGSLCPDSVQGTCICFTLPGCCFSNSNSTWKLLNPEGNLFLLLFRKKERSAIQKTKTPCQKKGPLSSRNSAEKTVEDSEILSQTIYPPCPWVTFTGRKVGKQDDYPSNLN